MARRRVFDKVNKVRGSTASDFNEAMAQIIRNEPTAKPQQAAPVDETPRALSSKERLTDTPLAKRTATPFSSASKPQSSGIPDVNAGKWKGSFFQDDM
jgi:hypothetical protein